MVHLPNLATAAECTALYARYALLTVEDWLSRRRVQRVRSVSYDGRSGRNRATGRRARRTEMRHFTVRQITSEWATFQDSLPHFWWTRAARRFPGASLTLSRGRWGYERRGYVACSFWVIAVTTWAQG